MNIAAKVYDPSWLFRVAEVRRLASEWTVRIRPLAGNPLPEQSHTFVESETGGLATAPRLVVVDA